MGLGHVHAKGQAVPYLSSDTPMYPQTHAPAGLVWRQTYWQDRKCEIYPIPAGCHQNPNANRKTKEVLTVIM